ncbi:unnamed protein product [Calypogeia fissa]
MTDVWSQRKTMNTYRLTNVTHSETAQCLPLPGLPAAFGAISPGLFLTKEEGGGGGSATKLRVKNHNDGGALLSQAATIVDLLRSTDVSYLSLKGDRGTVSANAGTGITAAGEHQGSLLAAVLSSDPDAFSYAPPGARQNNRRSGRSNSNVSPQTHGFPTHSSRAGFSAKAADQSPAQAAYEDHVADADDDDDDLPPEVPPSNFKTRMHRKSTGGKSKRGEKDFNKNLTGEDSSALQSSLCELLDEVFEKTDVPGGGEADDGGEDSGGFLTLHEIKFVAERVTNLRARNGLHFLPVHYLTKLLTFLDRHVQLAHDRNVESDDESDSENFSVIMAALEAVQISLLVMTEESMPRQVYKEEIIHRIIDITRYHIVHTVFTAYDPVYRQMHKKQQGDDDEDEDMLENGGGGRSAKKSRVRDRRSSMASKKAIPTRISGPVSNVLHKLCSILGLLKDLLGVERLMDSTILQLTHTVLATLAVDNVQLLQLKSIGVACMVFDLYPQHRTIVFDEIISLLWKLPSSKRNLRTFPLQDEEQSNHIQVFTAILLQLVQCSVTLPKVDALQPDTKADMKAGEATTNNEKPPVTLKCYEHAMESSMYFWKIVLQRWSAPKAHEGGDVKAVVENLVVDLLTTLNLPEFPASSLLLQVLCILLFGPMGIKAKDAVVRGAAIDLLGQIGARLKQDAVACTNEKLWILQGTGGKGNDIGNEDAALRKACVVCDKSKSSNQMMFSCDNCHRWFHGDCMGVTGRDLVGRRWLCLVCLCKRQLASLRSEIKPHVVGGPSLPKNKKVEDVDSSKEGGAVVQQILLNYLQEVAASDDLAVYAHRFYLCQWYRDEPQSTENLQFYHRRATAKTPVQDFGIAQAPLARNAILRIAGSLGQQRPLARGYDRILERLLAGLQENSPTPRAKALRAVSALVEVYPDILGDERVQRAVEGRFLDSAISVREAAMELVGRHIVSRPDFAVKYFEKISERIMDTGVSVRKRVIKIIRDVCMSNSGFAKATDGCLRIISRINDEESSIQDLVGKTFFELWFEEPSGGQGLHFTQQSVADGSSGVPQVIAERTQQLVEVLRGLPNNQAMVTIIKRSLALDFVPQAVKNSATSASTAVAVRHRCELMCKWLLESILKAEESSTEDAEIRALPHILALHAFCTVDPTLCAPASDPSKYAVTLQPYLKTQVDTRDAAQLLQSIVYVINSVLPLLRRPPESLVAELERDLRQLILRYSFLTVVYACIKCLCSLSKVATKGGTSLSFLARRFYKLLDGWRKEGYAQTEKANVLRMLFCLGVLVRYGSELIENMDDNEVTLPRILGLYKHFFASEDFDIKGKAIQAIGYVAIAKPEFLMEKEMGMILEASLSANADYRIKMQMLRNFSDYLLDVEEKMGIGEVENHDTGSKAVPVAAGAGDSNICGGIIQLHWDQILERCLDSSIQVRQSSLKVVEVVLRQGLVHPMTCVPQLIALETDHYEANSKLAHRLLVNLLEKYPSFFESRLGDGLQLSFSFLQSGGAGDSLGSANTANGPVRGKQSIAKIAKSGISRIYKLIRGSRVSRNKFLSSVIRKFDTAASGNPSSVPFLVYCAEVLSSLPFGLPDEPLYIVYSINRVVQVRGGVLEASMKASISDGSLGVVAKHVLGEMAEEKQQKGKEAYDMNATEDLIPEAPVERVDDTEGIPQDALERLQADCSSAMALALLLRLKRHLKIMYNLNDARCQDYSPTETIKPGDIISRRDTIKEFSTAELPTDTATTVRQMLEQYQAFKRLLKEDAMDYSTYTANIPTKKRGRAAAVNNVEAGEAGPAHASTTPVTRTLRKRNQTAAIVDGAD